jgi:hypothetical protein
VLNPLESDKPSNGFILVAKVWNGKIPGWREIG